MSGTVQIVLLETTVRGFSVCFLPSGSVLTLLPTSGCCQKVKMQFNCLHLNSNVNSNLLNHDIIFIRVTLWVLAARINKNQLSVFLSMTVTSAAWPEALKETLKQNYHSLDSQNKNWSLVRKKLPCSPDQAPSVLTCVNVEILVM